MLERTFSGEKVSKIHLERVQKELKTLYEERTEVQTLRASAKTFELAKERNLKLLQELKDRLKETEEDSVKLRERLMGEVEKEKSFAITKFSKEVLLIIDNLERAMTKCAAEEKETNIYQGLELTLNHALQILARFGVRPMDNPVGNIFDPKYHEVVFEAPIPSKPQGTVIEVMTKGYLIQDRLLRPAVVGVSQ